MPLWAPIAILISVITFLLVVLWSTTGTRPYSSGRGSVFSATGDCVTTASGTTTPDIFVSTFTRDFIGGDLKGFTAESLDEIPTTAATPVSTIDDAAYTAFNSAYSGYSDVYVTVKTISGSTSDLTHALAVNPTTKKARIFFYAKTGSTYITLDSFASVRALVINGAPDDLRFSAQDLDEDITFTGGTAVTNAELLYPGVDGVDYIAPTPIDGVIYATSPEFQLPTSGILTFVSFHLEVVNEDPA